MQKSDFIKMFDGLPDDAVVCLADFNDGYCGPSEVQAEIINLVEHLYRPSVVKDCAWINGTIILIGRQC